MAGLVTGKRTTSGGSDVQEQDEQKNSFDLNQLNLTVNHSGETANGVVAFDRTGEKGKPLSVNPDVDANTQTSIAALTAPPIQEVVPSVLFTKLPVPIAHMASQVQMPTEPGVDVPEMIRKTLENHGHDLSVVSDGDKMMSVHVPKSE